MPKLSEIVAKTLPPQPSIDYTALPSLSDYTRVWVAQHEAQVRATIRELCAVPSLAAFVPSLASLVAVSQLPEPVPVLPPSPPATTVINVYVIVAEEEERDA